jgi:hypothetical protein
MILEVHKQDMVDMMQMHNKSVEDMVMNHQELEIVDGKYHQVMVQQTHTKELTVIQQDNHQVLDMTKDMEATTISS